MCAKCIDTINALWSSKRLSNANCNAGILGRILVKAISAITSTSCSPAINASNIHRAVLPITSDTTESSLTPA